MPMDVVHKAVWFLCRYILFLSWSSFIKLLTRAPATVLSHGHVSALSLRGSPPSRASPRPSASPSSTGRPTPPPSCPQPRPRTSNQVEDGVIQFRENLYLLKLLLIKNCTECIPASATQEFHHLSFYRKVSIYQHVLQFHTLIMSQHCWQHSIWNFVKFYLISTIQPAPYLPSTMQHIFYIHYEHYEVHSVISTGHWREKCQSD